ncbi:MAG: glutamate--tRNA ligase [Ruminococcus sp.]
MSKRVRTRFAPSPTGYMHIGNLRTALYAYLIAKKDGGDFILRIEDTDQERYVEGAVDVIYDTLKIAGLNWDEGPDIGGPVGPYVQSERMGMFKSYAEELVKTGHAYYCFCDKERLDEVRKIQEASRIAPMYDRHCRDLSPEEVQAKLDAGVPYVIRQKMPLEGTTTFHDEIYGDITVENSTLDDQILIKTDGMPTYNFANVVDDHLMGITHVVRGNEYLSSAPKYNLLYEAFGWDVPTYVHCAPVMKDQTHKLSKRNGDASFQDLMEKGYLPQAVLNFIALLGWAPTGEQEIYTLDELKQVFSISGISKSPAIFDSQKLRAINAAYVHKMTPEEFQEAAVPYIRQTVKRTDIDLPLLCSVLQNRTEVFSDIPEQVDFIDQMPEYDLEMYRHKKMKTTPETALEALQAVLPVLEGVDTWDVEHIHEVLFAKIAEMGVKNGWMLWPVRTAVSGKQFTPGGGVELCAILGKEDTLNRIRSAIDTLSAACAK